MARYQREFSASVGFPIRTDERFIVRGIGGEPDEHWRVLYVNEGKTRTFFKVEIEERGGV